MRLTMGGVLLALVLFSCAYQDSNVKYTFTPPQTVAEKSCTLQCQQINNQCVQLEIERAKMFVIGKDKSQYLLYMNRGICDRDYRACYTDCGGTVSLK